MIILELRIQLQGSGRGAWEPTSPTRQVAPHSNVGTKICFNVGLNYCIVYLVFGNMCIQCSAHWDCLSTRNINVTAFLVYSNSQTAEMAAILDEIFSSAGNWWSLYMDVTYPVTFLKMSTLYIFHDDVIKWKHFPRNWLFVRGIHRSPVNSPHKGQWRTALMFSLICVWINDWVNNREAGDLRRYRAHYDVIVMCFHVFIWFIS